MEDIKSRLRELFVKSLRLRIDPAQVGDTDLIKTLGIDSVSALEVLIWVENEFNITIEDQDLSPALVNSLDTLAGYVQSKTAEPSAGGVA